eukprot:m.161826 g.161826  ORF g.161826 m.161826 type:complete len:611 (+) comp18056_c0_seq1:215-2047(+)
MAEFTPEAAAIQHEILSKMDPKEVCLAFGTDSTRAPPGSVEVRLNEAEEQAISGDDRAQRKQRRREERDALSRGWKLLNDSDIRMTLTVDTGKITEVVERRVVCANCRKAVNGLLDSLARATTPQPIVRGLVMLPGGQIAVDGIWKSTIDRSATEELLWKSFVTCESGDDVCEVNRRTRRCKGHSTDARKAWTSWLELWLALPPDSVAQLLLVHLDMFEHKYLADWLDRHRVCEHCRPRILGALDYLVDGPDPTDPESTASYDPALFEGLRLSDDGGWIHVGPDITFVDSLLARAMVNRRTNEVHATTDAVGQERVLECIAELIHERLQRLAQKLQDEELCWTILYRLGVESIREQFWATVDKKHGALSIDELLADINSEDAPEKEQPNPKKKAKKQKQKERARQKKLAEEAAKAAEKATVAGREQPISNGDAGERCSCNTCEVDHSSSDGNGRESDGVALSKSTNKGKQARLKVPTTDADRDSGCEGSASSYVEAGGAVVDEADELSQVLNDFQFDREEERRLLLAMGWNGTGNDEEEGTAADFALTDEEIRDFQKSLAQTKGATPLERSNVHNKVFAQQKGQGDGSKGSRRRQQATASSSTSRSLSAR